jgi:hypothetical protein
VIRDSGSGVSDSGLRVKGFGTWVQGVGCKGSRVWGIWFGV